MTPPLLLFSITMMLVCTGLLMIYSASISMGFLVRQAAYGAVGLLALFVCYHINYTHWRRWARWIMLGSLASLVAVLVVGVEINGSRRWLGVGPLRFQPSEPAKLALIIYMAKMLADRRQYLKSFFSGVFPALLVTAVFGVAIVVEPDMGAAMVLGAAIFGMWLAAEMRWFHLLGLLASAIPPFIFAILLEPYRVRRLMAFLTMDKEAIRSWGFQLYQSMIAVGSGGIWGLGLGESVQKYYYVSEKHTDFIFAIMGEELGFVRMSLVVLAYAVLVTTGWRVAMRTTDLFGCLLASGITLMIFINASINMGVVLGLLPTTGMVLPFVSYGGTALVVYLAAMGILMNIARNEHAHATHGRSRRPGGPSRPRGSMENR